MAVPDLHEPPANLSLANGIATRAHLLVCEVGRVYDYVEGSFEWCLFFALGEDKGGAAESGIVRKTPPQSDPPPPPAMLPVVGF